MSEITPSFEQSAEAYLAERKVWMQDAVEKLTGNRDLNPLDVFPPAGDVRADGKSEIIIDGVKQALTQENEQDLREIGGRFGLGGEVDVKSPASIQLLEGGKPWKVEAEVAITEKAQTILFAGAPDRIIGKDEAAYLTAKWMHAATEYEMVRQIAEKLKGYTPAAVENSLPYGYDLANKFTVTDVPTGQFVIIGQANGVSVGLLRVERETTTDESGNIITGNRPDSAALLRILDGVLRREGDLESGVGLNTSSTYASRAVDIVRAGLESGRNFRVGMYGRETLARVRGTAVEPSAVNQLPGEFHVIAEKLQLLARDLQDNSNR